MKKPRLTKDQWNAALDSFRWSEPQPSECLPPDYALWMQKNGHSHEFCELVIGLSGSPLYGLSGKAYDLSPGGAALIPRGAVHDECYSKHHAAGVNLWFHFLPHGTVTINFTEHEPDGKFESFPMLGATIQFAEEGHKACTVANSIHGQRSEQKARHYLAYFALEVAEYLMEADFDAQSADDGSVIEGVKLYIMAHLTDRLTLADLAKASGYSPFHFHRTFLEVEGITPRAFVEGQRLKSACHLLKIGQSITSAALDTGFSTPSQFTQVFKKQFGLSPSEWLKSHR